MDKIAVLIPCFNESQTIEKVVSDWKRELPEAVIYVYDNNSSDNTADLATKAGAVVRHEYSQGKGNVIRRMFREIDAQCYIMVDGDDTYPAEYGKQMANLVLKKRTDMVVGDRLSSTYFDENKRPFHNFGNCIVRGSINRLFKTDIRDIMTGYRAFSYLFVKSFPVLSKGFEIETDMTIHAVDKNMRIENVIIEIINENNNKGRRTGLGEIGSRIQKKYNDFDVRQYGYSSLSTFIDEIDSFVLIKENNTVHVALKEDNDVKEKVVQFAKEYVKKAGKNGIDLGALGQKIHGKYPNFKVKEYGYSTLQKFISGINIFRIESDEDNRKVIFLKEK